MDQFTGYLLSAIISILFMLIGWLIKKVNAVDINTNKILYLAKERSVTLNKLKDDLRELENLIDDLHDWHKPDSSGRQSWKDTGPVLDKLHSLCVLIEKSIS